MNGWEKFNTMAMWAVKLAYLNVMWIFFTFAGLVLFGLFPATVAMFTIVSKWLKQERDFHIFRTFWKTFRKEFIRLNGLALFFIAVGYFLYYDTAFLLLNTGELRFLIPILIFIFISYFVTLLFFFPVYVHFDLRPVQYIKQSFLIAIVSPLETLQILLSVIALYFLTTLFPGIIPLFTGSGLAMAVTWISYRAFTKVESKKSL